MLRALPRTVWILAASVLAAFLLGFVALDRPHAMWAIQYAGPWLVMLVIALFVRATVRAARDLDYREVWRNREYRVAAGVISLCALVLLVHGRFEMKVLMDELVLAANAASIHFDREFFTALRAHNVGGDYVTLAGLVDKRPMGFAVIVALVHDITGYRPENVFFVNGVVTVALLAAIYALGRIVSSHRGGLLAVLLWTGIPLVGLNAKGGGFELFNVLMMAVVQLSAILYLKREDARSQALLVMSAVLLGYARYESVVFVAPVGLLILWVWWRRREWILPVETLAAPLLLVLYPIQNSVFNNPRYWELAPGRTKPFSIDYFYDNVGHAMNFFYGRTGDQPSSLLVSTAGALAVGLLVFTLVRRGKELAARPGTLVFGAASVVILGLFGLMLVYHWATMDTFVVHRFTLPLQFLMVLAIPYVLAQLPRAERTFPLAIGVAALWLFAITLPFLARDVPSRTELAVQEIAWQRDWLRSMKGRDILYSNAAVLLPYTERVPAVPVSLLGRNKEGLRLMLQEKVYEDVYVYQRLSLDAATGEYKPEPSNELDPDIEVETVRERTFVPLYLGRLSRVVRIRGALAAGMAPSQSDPAEKKPRDAYLKRLMDGLP